MSIVEQKRIYGKVAGPQEGERERSRGTARLCGTTLFIQNAGPKFHRLFQILDNCDITDEKLMKLSPLIIKFEKVSLNGSQKMTALGWERLSTNICSPASHSKIRELQLKIAKNDDDVIRFRREVLLEELKGSSMTADSLIKIASFIPRLERVDLDDIFSDLSFLDMIKSRSENFAEAWKEVASSFINCPISKRKLRFFSLPGCAISDEILSILGPALVRIKTVRLGRNPITHQGWQYFKNCFVDAASCHEVALTHLSVSAAGDSGARLMHAATMDHLAPHVFPFLEELDLSGQCELGAEGWTALCNGIRMAAENGDLKLKSLVLERCKIKAEGREMLEDIMDKQSISNLKVEYLGGVEDDVEGKRRRSRLRRAICC